MLILSRKINEKICIGGNITLTIIDVKGDQVKVGGIINETTTKPIHIQ